MMAPKKGKVVAESSSTRKARILRAFYKTRSLRAFYR